MLNWGMKNCKKLLLLFFLLVPVLLVSAYPVNAKETAAKKTVYLTFDDGPGKYTNSILNILQKYHTKATFFMISGNMKNNPKNVRRIIRDGHYPALHSVSHDVHKLYKINSTNFADEMVTAQQTLYKITGFKSRLMRAPYGSTYTTKAMRDYAVKKGFKMWDWTVDPRDWALARHPEKILENIKAQTKRTREVIILHENSQTVKELPQILDYLRKRGYEMKAYDPKHHFTENFFNDKRL
ncbi:polysaccharide deacetylase family protein [Peribacillus sp. B-H-3]|uniref:polysaccharide deacetylase family protein n=1 Tax=Peribacillus sp. B-H-3 TaxID=3400420 RepID=UPI003B01548F